MASDEAYSTFLEQANQDRGASKSSGKPASASATVVNTDIPLSLQNLEKYYVSEADEPFEPVSLKWTGSDMPSEDEFRHLTGNSLEVSTLSWDDFDPKGQYKDILQAVEQVGDGKARIFRMNRGGTRAEYYIVGLDTKAHKVVGMRAIAVES